MTAPHAAVGSSSPSVSVCIPVYNCERYIGAAVRSALAQTHEDLEVVVIDNASTDGTHAVVAGIADDRIRLIRNPATVDPATNWNISIEKARGRYVKMMGADDVLYPDCVADHLAVMEGVGGGSVALVCTRRDIIDGNDRIVFRNHGWPHAGRLVRLPGRDAIRRMVRAGRNWIGEPVCVFFRTDAAMELGGFDRRMYPELGFCLDWDLWCRLLQAGDLVVCARTSVAFRVNAGSESLTITREFARHDQVFMRSLAERRLVDLKPGDLMLGSIRARRDGFLRRLCYLYVRLRGGMR